MTIQERIFIIKLSKSPNIFVNDNRERCAETG